MRQSQMNDDPKQKATKSTNYKSLLKRNRIKQTLSFTDKFYNKQGTIEIQQPELLHKQKYQKIYNDFIKDTTLIRRHSTIDANYKQKEVIKKSIEKILKKRSQEIHFNETFKIDRRKRTKSNFMQKSQIKSQIGISSIQKQQEFQRIFFLNRQKTLEFSQQCLLTEFFLKDKERKNKTPDLFSQLKQNIKHIRLLQNPEQNISVYLKHSQAYYKQLQACFNQKNKFVQNCLIKSKMHTSTRRKHNFKVIQYTLGQLTKNIIAEQKYIKKYEQQQLKYNNKIIRLLSQYKLLDLFILQQNNILQNINKFKIDLFQINPQYIIKEVLIIEKIENILRNKKYRYITIQDMKELISYLNDLFKNNIIQLFQNKFPHYFKNISEIIVQENNKTIMKYMKHNKLKFLLEIMFNTFPQKLIMQKYLPIKSIPHIFNYYKISQNSYKLTKLYTNYCWVQHHQEGLTCQQFVKGSIIFAMKKNKWEGIHQFLNQIDIKRYI